MPTPAYTDADQDIYETTENHDNDPIEDDEPAPFGIVAGLLATVTIAFAGGSLWLLHYAEQYGAQFGASL